MPDEDLLRRLRTAIEAADDLPVSDLVDAAWEDAVAETRSILQAMMTNALLERAVAHIQQAPSAATPEPQPASLRAAEAVADNHSHGAEAWTWYVYGVQAAGAAAPEGRGVGGAAVQALRAGAVQALVSPVPAEDFGEEALAAKVSDIEWLGAQAQAHEAVLSAALEAGTVLPLRFGAIFTSQQRVAALLEEQSAALVDELRRLDGHQEWSVKALVDEDALGGWLCEHDPAVSGVNSGEASSEGRAYFERKRREAAMTEARQRTADDVAQACHERLAAVSAAATTARPQDPSLSGYRGTMALNGIYLVREDDLDALRAQVATLEEQYGARGFSFVLTGPWPAHHFAEIPPLGGSSRSAGAVLA